MCIESVTPHCILLNYVFSIYRLSREKGASVNGMVTVAARVNENKYVIQLKNHKPLAEILVDQLG